MDTYETLRVQQKQMKCHDEALEAERMKTIEMLADLTPAEAEEFFYQVSHLKLKKPLKDHLHRVLLSTSQE